MSFWYTGAKERLANGNLDWDASDIRVLLAMTNTTADTDQDALTLSGITTMDEYDGTGYSRHALAAEAVVREARGTTTLATSVMLPRPLAIMMAMISHQPMPKWLNNGWMLFKLRTLFATWFGTACEPISNSRPT